MTTKTSFGCAANPWVADEYLHMPFLALVLRRWNIDSIIPGQNIASTYAGLQLHCAMLLWTDLLHSYSMRSFGENNPYEPSRPLLCNRFASCSVDFIRCLSNDIIDFIGSAPPSQRKNQQLTTIVDVIISDWDAVLAKLPWSFLKRQGGSRLRLHTPMFAIILTQTTRFQWSQYRLCFMLAIST